MLRKILSIIALAFDTSVFVIQIQNGRVQPLKGRPPRGFLSDLNEAATDMGLKTGTIKASREKSHIRISFSSDIPAALHQRLRNIWHLHEPGFR